MSLQPKPAVLLSPRLIAAGRYQHAVNFVGKAIAATGEIQEVALQNADLCTPPRWLLSFDVRDVEGGGAWEVLWGCWRCTRGESKKVETIQQRVVNAFAGGAFDRFTPGLMLGNHCLVCGKGLTDTASKARRVGPECWGSGTLSVPGLFRAEAVDGVQL
jgi:hypothetical protein